MSQYGCTIPRRGRELIAKILAAKMPLKISRIMMGQGVCPDEVFPGDLEDLVEPVAAGTSNEPTYDGDTVHMTVEYRSDLNGGLDHGFWIREFGVFAQDEDGSEVMLYYGTKEKLGRLKKELIYKDWFQTLPDFNAYVVRKNQALADYAGNPLDWAKRTLLNISKAGFFSSDRTIAEYNSDIWHLG